MKLKFKINFIILFLLFIFILSGCTSLSVFQYYVYDDSNYNIGNKAYNGEVQTIQIDWIVGNINIIKSTNHEIIINEEVDIEIEDIFKVHSKLENNILDIKFAGSSCKLEHSYKVKNLYVYLPTEINEININNISADIKINFVNIKDLTINNISGDIMIEDTSLNKVNLRNTSGEIIMMNNKINIVEVTSISGNVGLSFVNSPEKIVATTTSANVIIYIASQEQISATFESVLGKFSSNLDYQQEGNLYKFNNGGYLYSISSVSGNFKILKKG